MWVLLCTRNLQQKQDDYSYFQSTAFIKRASFSLLDSATHGRIHLPQLQWVKDLPKPELVTSIMILWREPGRSGMLEASSSYDAEGPQHSSSQMQTFPF